MSTVIAIVALLVAIISLVYSISKQTRDRRMASLERRTDLLQAIAAAAVEFERVEMIMAAAQPPSVVSPK